MSNNRSQPSRVAAAYATHSEERRKHVNFLCGTVYKVLQQPSTLHSSPSRKMRLSLQLAVVLAIQFGNVLSGGLVPLTPLSGVSKSDVAAYLKGVPVVGGQPLPTPMADTSSKLVNDAAHPWQPLLPGQQRGKDLRNLGCMYCG